MDPPRDSKAEFDDWIDRGVKAWEEYLNEYVDFEPEPKPKAPPEDERPMESR